MESRATFDSECFVLKRWRKPERREGGGKGVGANVYP